MGTSKEEYIITGLTESKKELREDLSKFVTSKGYGKPTKPAKKYRKSTAKKSPKKKPPKKKPPNRLHKRQYPAGINKRRPRVE